MGNSIEETIKQLKLMLKVRREQKEIIECAGGSCINCDPDIKALAESIDILSDYKRVLKENKQLRTEVNSSKKEYEKYKRLAEMNLKSAEEFKNNMCEHRCLLKSENEILQKENEGLKEYIAIAPNLDEMTATKYRNIQQDAYVQGRAEEQQKAEQIIHENYIPVQKIKDIQKEKEWALQSYDCTKADYKQSQAIGAWDALQELLEGRK